MSIGTVVTEGYGAEGSIQSVALSGFSTGAGQNVVRTFDLPYSISQVDSNITFNPLDKSSVITLSNGNLSASKTGSQWAVARATKSRATGKYYFEIENTVDANDGSAGYGMAGVAYGDQGLDTTWLGNGTLSAGLRFGDVVTRNLFRNGPDQVSVPRCLQGQRCMVAVDFSTRSVWWGVNGTWIGDPAAGTGASWNFAVNRALYPAIAVYGGAQVVTGKFSAASFAHAIPAGFSAWEDPAQDSGQDPHWSNVAMMMDFDNASSPWQEATGKTVTASNASISSFTKRSGVSSALTNGGGYLYTPNSADFDLGTKNFTIEASVFASSYSNNQYIITKRNTAATQLGFVEIYMNSNGDLCVALTESATTYLLNVNTGYRIRLRHMTDIAVERFGDIIYTYADGVLVNQSSISKSSQPILKSLLHFEGVNGATTLTDETGLPWSFTGNAQISTAQSRFGGSSLYVDGNGDYITAGRDITLGTSDYTIGCWFYTTATTTQNIFAWSGGTTLISVYITPGSNTIALQWNGTSRILSTSTTITTNAWHHVAVTRINGTHYLFLNGVQIGSTTTAVDLLGGPIEIGRRSGNTQMFAGYVDEFRCIQTAVYVGAFTPLAAPFETTTLSNSAVRSLLRFNGTNGSQTFHDEAGRHWTANGNVQLSTAQSVFGGSSAYFDGTGDFLDGGNHRYFYLSNEDFTFEARVRLDSYLSFRTIFGDWSAATGYKFLFSIDASGRVCAHANGGAIFTSTASLSLNQWYHVAFVRRSGIITAYLDGVSVATAAASGTIGSAANSILTIGAASGATHPFHGYIDDARVVIGQAIYTGNFAVSTSPVTDEIKHPFIKSLVHFDGSNSSASIADDTGRQWTVSGSAAISTAQSKFDGSSAYIPAGSYIQTANSADLRFGTEDFSVDFWVRLDNVTNWTSLIQLGDWNSSGCFTLISGSSGLKACIAGTDTFNGGTPLTQNTWHHVAITRTSGLVRIFKDGALMHSATAAGNINSTDPLKIFGGGGIIGNSSGYIDELRIIKGRAVYQGNFPVQTQKYSASTRHIGSIVHFNGPDTSTSAFDETLKRWTPAGTTALSTTQSYTGGSSLRLRGEVNPNYISTLNHDDLIFGTGDFTIEYRVRHDHFSANNAGSANQCHISKGLSNWAVLVATDGSLIWYAGAIVATTSIQMTANAWHHIAIARQGGTLRLFIDGVLGASVSNSTNYSGTDALAIGISNPGISGYMTGYFDELRITKGTALYTEAFTPPVGELQAIDQKAAVYHNSETLRIGSHDGLSNFWSGYIDRLRITNGTSRYGGTYNTLNASFPNGQISVEVQSTFSFPYQLEEVQAVQKTFSLNYSINQITPVQRTFDFPYQIAQLTSVTRSFDLSYLIYGDASVFNFSLPYSLGQVSSVQRTFDFRYQLEVLRNISRTFSLSYELLYVFRQNYKFQYIYDSIYGFKYGFPYNIAIGAETAKPYTFSYSIGEVESTIRSFTLPYQILPYQLRVRDFSARYEISTFSPMSKRYSFRYNLVEPVQYQSLLAFRFGYRISQVLSRTRNFRLGYRYEGVSGNQVTRRLDASYYLSLVHDTPAATTQFVTNANGTTDFSITFPAIPQITSDSSFIVDNGGRFVKYVGRIHTVVDVPGQYSVRGNGVAGPGLAYTVTIFSIDPQSTISVIPLDPDGNYIHGQWASYVQNPALFEQSGLSTAKLSFNVNVINNCFFNRTLNLSRRRCFVGNATDLEEVITFDPYIPSPPIGLRTRGFSIRYAIDPFNVVENSFEIPYLINEISTFVGAFSFAYEIDLDEQVSVPYPFDPVMPFMLPYNLNVDTNGIFDYSYSTVPAGYENTIAVLESPLIIGGSVNQSGVSINNAQVGTSFALRLAFEPISETPM